MLLATFVPPRFQHYFWKRQGREELRFAVATEVNRLAAEFIMGVENEKRKIPDSPTESAGTRRCD
jgi:hypothetical protein